MTQAANLGQVLESQRLRCRWGIEGLVHLLQRAPHTHCTTRSDTQPGQTTTTTKPTCPLSCEQDKPQSVQQAHHAPGHQTAASRSQQTDHAPAPTPGQATRARQAGAQSAAHRNGTHTATQTLRAWRTRHGTPARHAACSIKLTQHTYNHTRKRQTYRARQVRRGTPHGSNKLTRHAHNRARARDRHADCGTLHARAPSIRHSTRTTNSRA